MKAEPLRSVTARQFALSLVLAAGLLAGAGCHPKTIAVSASSAAIGGTIAGVLYGPPEMSLSDRTVTVVNVESGERYQTATGQGGGYTLRVPPGTYRLEVQLREGETFANGDARVVVHNVDVGSGKTVDVNVGRQ